MVEIVENTGGIETTCEKCKSRLRYKLDEVFVVYRGANYGGDTPDPYTVIKCPACGSTTDVDAPFPKNATRSG